MPASTPSFSPFKPNKLDIFKSFPFLPWGPWLKGHSPVYNTVVFRPGARTHPSVSRLEKVPPHPLSGPHIPFSGRASHRNNSETSPGTFASLLAPVSLPLHALFPLLQILFSASCLLGVNRFREVLPDGLYLSYAEALHLNRAYLRQRHLQYPKEWVLNSEF